MKKNRFEKIRILIKQILCIEMIENFLSTDQFVSALTRDLRVCTFTVCKNGQDNLEPLQEASESKFIVKISVPHVCLIRLGCGTLAVWKLWASPWNCAKFVATFYEGNFPKQQSGKRSEWAAAMMLQSKIIWMNEWKTIWILGFPITQIFVFFQ